MIKMWMWDVDVESDQFLRDQETSATRMAAKEEEI